MLVANNIGPGGTFLGGGIMARGSLLLGISNTMIIAGFSASAHIMQCMEGVGAFALRRHRGKFGGTQPQLAFDRERQ